MDTLAALFPRDDFGLIAGIIGLPLLGAVVNGVWGRRLGKNGVRFMALASVGASFLVSVVAFALLAHYVYASGTPEHEHVRVTWTAWEWMNTSSVHDLVVPIALRFSIDALSAVMMLIVTGVGFLIHLYATSYMESDAGYWRFFAYMNLFVFAMLVLILGDNLPVLFVGWEGVGLCSYLLIGFWYGDMPNAKAGKKAFLANRIGDFGPICAMFLFVFYTGALDWNGIDIAKNRLLVPNEALELHIWPIGGGIFEDWHLGALTIPLHILQPAHGAITMMPATAVGLMLLLGCTGKSAQIPLYVWLPDAMAGPTPVSALIHAATMVTAGVYLVCRLSFVFVLSPLVMALIATIGVVTALFAATIALVQNDIKKVLAYSTVSQLGFMFAGVGVGAFAAGFFHVFTHAFFKACLFLGAGSVIHAMHARIHDGDAAQDVRNMGGLRKYMPLTFWTFVASVLAISGCPFTSGFFSKDEILFRSFVNHPVSPLAKQFKGKMVLDIPSWFGPVLYAVGVAAATLTALYMFRLLFLMFFGEFKGWKVGRPSLISAHEGVHHHDLKTPGYPPHESPWQMTVPLIILGTCAIVAGVLNMGMFHVTPMDHWLDPVFRDTIDAAGLAPTEAGEKLAWPLALGGLGAFVIGTGAAYWMYIAQEGVPARRLADALPRLYRLVYDKWRVDELYDATVLAAVDALGDTAAAFDQVVVDGIFAKLTSLVVMAAGSVLRVFQNGVVHTYAAIMVVGLLGIGGFFVTPHADATVSDAGNGDYVIDASPGLGYAYRWDADGDGKPDTEKFNRQMQAKVHLEPDEWRWVHVEVINAFGLRADKAYFVSRPKPEKIERIQVGMR